MAKTRTEIDKDMMYRKIMPSAVKRMGEIKRGPQQMECRAWKDRVSREQMGRVHLPMPSPQTTRRRKTSRIHCPRQHQWQRR